MRRTGKSSLAPGEHKTRAKRLSELEVQRATVLDATIPDEPSDTGIEMLSQGEVDTVEIPLISDEQLDAVDAKHDEAEALTDDVGATDELADEADEDDEPQTSGLTREIDSPPIPFEDLGIPQPPIRAVEFPTRRDYTIITQALQFRQAEIEKKAKGLEDAGYPKEARILRGDAAAIKDVILPEFRPQIEMQLVTPSELNYGVKNKMRALVHRFATRCAKAGDVSADVAQAEDAMLDQLAIKIGAFGRDVAERAFAAGVAYREAEPSALAEKSLDSLSGTGVA